MAFDLVSQMIIQLDVRCREVYIYREMEVVTSVIFPVVEISYIMNL